MTSHQLSDRRSLMGKGETTEVLQSFKIGIALYGVRVVGFT